MQEFTQQLPAALQASGAVLPSKLRFAARGGLQAEGLERLAGLRDYVSRVVASPALRHSRALIRFIDADRDEGRLGLWRDTDVTTWTPVEDLYHRSSGVA